MIVEQNKKGMGEEIKVVLEREREREKRWRQRKKKGLKMEDVGFQRLISIDRDKVGLFYLYLRRSLYPFAVPKRKWSE